MRIVLAGTLGWIFVSNALAAGIAVVPNGGAAVASLSVIDTATGRIDRSLVTAVSGKVMINSSFVITNAGDSAAVLSSYSQHNSDARYILSAVNLTTGKITKQRDLAVPRKGTVMIAASPLASVFYLGYGDAGTGFHIQAIDPVTLHVILDANLGAHCGRYMTVSPDGQRIYLTGATAVVAVQSSTLKPIGTVPLSDSSYATVSPDSATLYVAAGKYPDIAVTVVNTATLQAQSVPVAEISVVFGMAVSPDGSQLYISGQANFQGTDIFTLDLATQSLMAVSAVVTENIAVSPNGTVYVGDGSGVVVFDPASQTIKGIFSAYSSGSLALNSSGSKLHFLNEFSSSLATAGPPPASTSLGTAATGYFSSAAYDATNNRILVADNANNVEVLNAATLEPAGHVFLPDSSYAYVNANGGSGFVTMGELTQVVRFDPVSLKVTGTVNLPNRIYDTVSYSPPVMNGSTLYVPFAFTQNGARPADVPSSVPRAGIAVVDTHKMKVVATWPFHSLPLLGLAQGGTVAYSVVLANGGILYLQEIDLNTGQVALHAKVPGVTTANAYSNPAVSPDGSTVYVSMNNTLYTFDAKTLALTNTVLGLGLINLTLSPDGDYLYGATAAPCETCSEPYSMQIVSTSSLQVVGTLPSAEQPGPALFVGF